MDRDKKSSIIIFEPSPFSFVGADFQVAGSVMKELFEKSPFKDRKLALEFLDHTGKLIMGSTIDALSSQSRDDYFLYFQFIFYLNPSQYKFYEQSQGRMTLCFAENEKNFLDEARKETYVPIIIEQFAIDSPNTKKISELHKSTQERIQKYRKDTKKYHKELQEISDRKEKFYSEGIRVSDLGDVIQCDDLLNELFWEMGSACDEERRKIDEKYRESIEWTGPILTGSVGRQNGFQFKVYSNDHDMHFHVIHKEMEVDARFSFPELKLLSYKGRSKVLNKKSIEKIQNFFRVKKNFERLKNEFGKRSSTIK